MNSLTEQERLGLDDVFMSISTHQHRVKFFEQIKHYFKKVDFKTQMKKPKKALFALKKSFKKSKNRQIFSKKVK